MNSSVLAVTAAAMILTATQCQIGKVPADVLNSTAKPFVHDDAAESPVGAVLAGATDVSTGQTFNTGDQRLEGGTSKPVTGTLPDFSSAGIARKAASYQKVIKPFTAAPDSEEGFEHENLRPAEWTEFGTVLNRAERGAFQIEIEKPHENNPLMYMEELGKGVYAPLVLEYAPANDRYAAIIERLQAAPDFIATAQANLKSTSAVRAGAAIESARGVIQLVTKVIPASLPDGMKGDYDAASSAAVSAIEGYISFVRGMSAGGDWQAGAALYDKKLQLDSGQPSTSASKVLEKAEDMYESAHADLIRAAEPINRRIYGGSRPRDDFRLMNDVLEVLETENRARSNQGMMDQMKIDAEEARKICNEQELAPVPASLNLNVVATPEFMRPSIPLAGGFGPSAAATDNNAIVWLTPAPADASSRELRDRLTTNNKFQLKLLALRYGIPGYALLGALASEMETAERKLVHYVNPLPAYVHGWPIYITESTVGAAYSGDVDFIWRKYRVQTIAAAIADIKMHTGELSADDAVTYLVRKAYMEASAARALVRSIQINPTSASIVFLGWQNWQRIREHYQETTQDFSPSSFHGKALRAGSMPPIEFSYAITEARGRLKEE
jgi:hypothetical protein